MRRSGCPERVALRACSLRRDGKHGGFKLGIVVRWYPKEKLKGVVNLLLSDKEAIGQPSGGPGYFPDRNFGEV